MNMLACVILLVCAASVVLSALFLAADTSAEFNANLNKPGPTILGFLVLFFALSFSLKLFIIHAHAIGTWFHNVRIQNGVRMMFITFSLHALSFHLLIAHITLTIGAALFLVGCMLFCTIHLQQEEVLATCRQIFLACAVRLHRRSTAKWEWGWLFNGKGEGWWLVLILGIPCFASITIQAFKVHSLYLFFEGGLFLELSR